MLLPYFTILHWLAILFFFILFVALSVLSAKSNSTKIALSMIFASFLVTTFGAVLSVFILEKYTKKATLLQMKQRRILFNETYVLKGRVKNVGKFPIKYCKFEVKIVNNGSGRGEFVKGSMFKSGGFNIFGAKDKDVRPNTIKKSFVILNKKLNPRYSKNFSVIFKYPPYFRNTYLNYKLYCH